MFKLCGSNRTRDNHARNLYPYIDLMSSSDSVTGSMLLGVIHFSNKKKIRILVDAGNFQEKEYLQRNNQLICDPKQLKAVLITHGHNDHLGRLPYLYHCGYTGYSYTSLATRMIAKEALEDDYRIKSDLAKRQNVKSRYNRNDVEKSIENMKAIEYYKCITIYKKGKNKVNVTALKNAHIFGACAFLVTVYDENGKSINVYFSGDYNKSHDFFCVKKIPKNIRQIPNITVVVESTYGDTYSKDIQKKFEEDVAKITTDNYHRTLVVTVFSLDRAQKVLYLLKKMQNSGTLDSNIPIYYDGKLSQKYTNMIKLNPKVFCLRPNMLDFLPQNLIFVNSGIRQRILQENRKKIIVTTAGMGNYGPAHTYLPHFVSDPRAAIYFAGYQQQDTAGRRLIESKNNETIQLNGLMKVRRAAIYQTGEFSSHGSADVLLRFLSEFKKIGLVVINHGEQQTKEKFAEAVVKDEAINAKDVGILDSSIIFRITPYGLTKTVPRVQK